MRDGWKTLPLSDVVEHTIGGVWGGESGTEEVEVTVVRSTEFTKRGFLNFETGVSRSIKHSQLKSRELKEGDILLEKSGGGPDQPVGRVVYVTAAIPKKFVCSNFVQLVRPNSMIIEPLLLFHIMWQWHAIDRTLEFQAQTTGIRNLRTPDYLDQEIYLPPLPEQKRIVDLISSVDSYIETLQQQLESANTSRNAVLSELLTAGGDDWVEATLGDLISYSIGGIWGEDPGNSEIDVPVYRQTEFNDSGILTTPADAYRSITKNQLKSRTLLYGDILIQKSAGTPTLPGRVVMVPELNNEVATFSNFLNLLRPDQKKCLPRFAFLYFWFKHHTGRAYEFQRGTNIKNLDLPNYLEEMIFLPPLPEQKRIVEIIKRIDEVISQTELTTSKAQSLRSGLLSDLLSGEHEIPESYDKVIGAA